MLKKSLIAVMLAIAMVLALGLIMNSGNSPNVQVVVADVIYKDAQAVMNDNVSLTVVVQNEETWFVSDMWPMAVVQGKEDQEVLENAAQRMVAITDDACWVMAVETTVAKLPILNATVVEEDIPVVDYYMEPEDNQLMPKLVALAFRTDGIRLIAPS